MSRPRIAEYKRMVMKAAWSAYYKLPLQTRSWIDAEDLIQDGLLFAKYYVVPRYRPHRASFSTFLTRSLDNFYKGMLEHHYTQKRNKCTPVSISSCFCQLHATDPIEEEIHAVQAFQRIATIASPQLRFYLNQFLFTRGKLRPNKQNFAVAVSELRVLARQHSFTRDDLSFLLKNESWRHRMPTLNSVRAV